MLYNYTPHHFQFIFTDKLALSSCMCILTLLEEVVLIVQLGEDRCAGESVSGNGVVSGGQYGVLAEERGLH